MREILVPRGWVCNQRNARPFFNQKNFLFHSSFSVVCMTRHCFLVLISNCSRDFLWTWGDRSNVYSLRVSGNRTLLPGNWSSRYGRSKLVNVMVILGWGFIVFGDTIFESAEWFKTSPRSKDRITTQILGLVLTRNPLDLIWAGALRRWSGVSDSTFPKAVKNLNFTITWFRIKNPRNMMR